MGWGRVTVIGLGLGLGKTVFFCLFFQCMVCRIEYAAGYVQSDRPSAPSDRGSSRRWQSLLQHVACSGASPLLLPQYFAAEDPCREAAALGGVTAYSSLQCLPAPVRQGNPEIHPEWLITDVACREASQFASPPPRKGAEDCLFLGHLSSLP